MDDMDDMKKKLSEAQRAAQKKYDEKTKTISVKYTPANMNEYRMMMNYLVKTGESRNGFIKWLIKDFFESGRDKEKSLLSKVY